MTLFRVCCCLLGLVSCLSVLRLNSPDWLATLRSAGSLALDVGINGGEHQRTADLNRQREVVRQRLRAKNRVIQQVLSREMSLLEAAAWFRFFNMTPEDCPELRLDIGGEGEGEQYCRQVIGWVRAELQQSRTTTWTGGEVVRLERELDDLLHRKHTIELPSL